MATRQQTQTAVGAHLVGGLKAPDAETAMRTAARILGRHVRSIPDGETGDRSQWIFWQLGRLSDLDGIEVSGLSENPDVTDRWLEGVTATDGTDGAEALRNYLEEKT